MKKGIWFTHGFSNLHNALSDIRSADTAQAYALICSHRNRNFVGLQAADVALTEPTTRDSAFIDAVLDRVAEHNVRAIFPTNTQRTFNQFKLRFQQRGCAVATVADSQILDAIDDKAALYRCVAGRASVAIPDYQVFSTQAEFFEAHQAVRQRHAVACIKPNKGVYGSGFRILKDGSSSLKDLLNETPEIGIDSFSQLLAAADKTSMMVMQFLEGEERSVDCLAYQGKLIGGVVRRKLLDKYAGQVIEDNPVLMRQVAELTSELGLNGMFNVQFKDSDGVHFLLEINPRLSGGSFYATAAGLNIPYLAAQVFTGAVSPDDVHFELKAGVQLGSTSVPVLNRATPAPLIQKGDA